jgi:polyphosphate:AMP phosphotransferase
MFLGSWYNRPLIRRFQGKINDDGLDTAMKHISTFEEALVDDGTLLLKFWYHLGKAAQKKRIRKLQKDPTTAWRVQPVDQLLVKRYEEYRRVAERALRQTSTAKAPWVIVDGSDARSRHLTVAGELAGALARRLETGSSPAPTLTLPAVNNSPPRPSILESLDLTKKLPREGYKDLVDEYQAQVNILARKAYRQGLSSVLVFEGWDAAGKGGIVRRLVSALDPRDYTIIPVGAPTDEEKAHHYLWRFWRHLPRAGHVLIFDRSWYGRVLVERVEGFTPEEVWQRAYREINDFEQQLWEHGMLLLKFWLHIDKDEQLRRFHDREGTPFKRYKITEDDYRNRNRWDDYDRAVNDMVERCSTEFAPWHLIEANDKNFARIKVLKLFCRNLEERL